jgi:hypothetical protein
VRVDNPTQNLESYFLDVVAKARAANETSGAQSGARVAEYLRGGMETQPATEKVLEKLSLPQAAQKISETKVSAPIETKLDEKKLAALTQASEKIPAPKISEQKIETEKLADLSKADEKLSSLLGKQK